MPVAFATCAAALVVIAAVRSTWSPCGWSMLSTITPLSERSRGHRFGVTGAWFVGGAVLGGSLLGALAAAGSLGLAALDLSPTVRLAVAAAASVVALGFDAGLARPALPHHRRQVNEDWLDEFRPWVYAAGFGLQIGTGLATYIMTTAVYLVVLLGALSGSWLTAIGMGASFGLLRGLAVFTGFRNSDPIRLGAFHRRFAELDAPVRRATIVVIASVPATLLTALTAAPPALTAAVPIVALLGAGVWATIGGRQAAATLTPDSAPLRSAAALDRRSSEPTTA